MSGNEIPSREALNAYVDGELSPHEMTRVAALLTRHADLQAYVARQQALRRRLDEALSPVLAQTVPVHLQQSVRRAPLSGIARWSEMYAKWRAGVDQRSLWRVAVPTTAALAVGLIVGVEFDRFEPLQIAFVQEASTGQMVAQGALDHALSEQLASENNSSSAIRVAVSFRNKRDAYCRTFAMDGYAVSTSGVACRGGEQWVVVALASTEQDTSPHAPYQAAGGAMPDAIRNTVNAMIEGAPFDAVAEREARGRHWSGTR